MSLRESLELAGRLTLRLSDREGRVVHESVAHNDITIHGRDLVARLFNAELATTPIPRVTQIGLGSDDGAFDPQANGLGRGLGFTPITTFEDETVMDGGRPRKRLRLTGELAEGDFKGKLLHEAGLFTEDGKVMYNRVTFPTITKTDQFKLTLVWEITF